MHGNLKVLIESLVRETLLEIQLDEGGLGGHMMHLYDNQDLTFGDMKNVFKLAASGELEEVTEKIDGQNVFFSYDIPTQTLRFSRNKGNIKSGGMQLQDMIAKWRENPGIGDAFSSAYQVVDKSVQSLGPAAQASIFGPNHNVWYSGEVVAANSPNVINYDRDAFVIHPGGTVYDSNAKPVDIDTSANYAALVNVVNQFRDANTGSSWDILEPVLVQMKRMENDAPAQDAIAAVSSIASEYGLSDGDTILDYVSARFYNSFFVDMDFPEDQKRTISKIIARNDINITTKKNQIKEIVLF